MAEIPTGYDPFGPTAEGLLDKKGTPFNPSLHQAYKGGRAFLTRVGEWVKKGGRPKADAAPVSPAAKPAEKGVQKVIDPIAAHEAKNPAEGLSTPGVTQPAKVKGAAASVIPEDALNEAANPPAPGMPPVSPNASVENAKLEASSRAAVLASEGLLVLVFGQSQAHTKDEREARLEEWRLFLEGTPGFQLPPWMTLALGYAIQVSARADKPDFQKRCAMWGGKFKKWFGKG